MVNDLAGDEQFAWLSSHAQRILAVPLQRQEQVLGACSSSTSKAENSIPSTASC